jgi:hypothetical protein
MNLVAFKYEHINAWAGRDENKYFKGKNVAAYCY